MAQVNLAMVRSAHMLFHIKGLWITKPSLMRVESCQDTSLTVSVFNPFINKIKFLIPPNVKNKYWDVN